MNENLMLRNLTIAPGVIETIVALAIAEVEGVAAVGTKQSPGGLVAALNKKQMLPGILIYEEDDQVVVDAHVQVFYGYRLPDIVESIKLAVVDALQTQASIEVSMVHVTIDAIQFSG